MPVQWFEYFGGWLQREIREKDKRIVELEMLVHAK